MKGLLTVIAFCATAFPAAGALTTPAAADSGRHGSGLYTQGSGGNFAFSFSSGGGRHGVQRAERRHPNIRPYQKFKRRHLRPRHFWRHRPRLRHGWQFAGASCHRVRRHGFDRHGYRVLFGSVRCYNAYGRPYIVDRSRTIIQRY